MASSHHWLTISTNNAKFTMANVRRDDIDVKKLGVSCTVFSSVVMFPVVELLAWEHALRGLTFGVTFVATPRPLSNRTMAQRTPWQQ